MKEYLADKKANSAYWDNIDDTVSDSIIKIAEKSEKHINEEQLNMYITDIISEVREIIIKQLELIGGKFPYVDENM